MAAAQTAAHQVVANASAAALPVVGIVSNAEMVSCFVEVPVNLVSTSPRPAGRTVLEIGSYREIVLRTFWAVTTGSGSYLPDAPFGSPVGNINGKTQTR